MKDFIEPWFSLVFYIENIFRYFPSKSIKFNKNRSKKKRIQFFEIKNKEGKKCNLKDRK